MIVGCAISFPGNTPHVTVFAAPSSIFVMNPPCCKKGDETVVYLVVSRIKGYTSVALDGIQYLLPLLLIRKEFHKRLCQNK